MKIKNARTDENNYAMEYVPDKQKIRKTKREKKTRQGNKMLY